MDDERGTRGMRKGENGDDEGSVLQDDPTMALPESSLAAVFEAANQPLALQRFSLSKQLAPGAVLCRVQISTLCGSDLHTVCGRRTEPTPCILGHESVGTVVAVGEGAVLADGAAVSEGDRVSWTVMASCGSCYYCGNRLPQKCERLIKYGHTATSLPPALTGGYAEYIHLFPGTGLFKLPDGLPEEIAAPANCALSTAIAGVEAVGGIEAGQSVLIFGAGLLGTYLTALCKEAGAEPILVAESNTQRAESILGFGAGSVFMEGAYRGGLPEWVRKRTGLRGVDVAFEVCGDPKAIPLALSALRIGGRLLVAGLVTPESRFEVDGNLLTRKCLSVHGIHNYRPEHLGQGLQFLTDTRNRYPHHEIVGQTFDLRDINEAFELAKQGRFLRVAVRC